MTASNAQPAISRRAFTACLALASLTATGTALMLLGSELASDGRYADLGTTSRGEPLVNDTTALDASRDWRALKAVNPDVAGWLTVSGTSIDLPVVSQRVKDPDGFYLNHDFWREPSTLGCPYLDRRSVASGSHLLIYGHHLLWSGEAFSELYRAWEPDHFSNVGEATWETPDGGAETLIPLCALRVDAGFADIQRFGFSGGREEMREWLAGLLDKADARSRNAPELATQAQKAMTLVTCSSALPNRRWRTLVLFVETGGSTTAPQSI